MNYKSIATTFSIFALEARVLVSVCFASLNSKPYHTWKLLPKQQSLPGPKHGVGEGKANERYYLL